MSLKDIIVVGGGIVGSSIVQQLLLQGLKVICLEDAEEPAYSATLASGAMLGAFGEVTDAANSKADRIEVEFRVQCARDFGNWLGDLGERVTGAPKMGLGTVILSNAAGKDDLANINAIHSAATLYGTPNEWLEASDVPSLKPHQSRKPYRLLFLPKEGFIDSNQLLGSVRRLNQSLQPNVYQQGVVRTLVTSGERVVGVECTNGEVYKADKVVLCCGIPTSTILEESGITSHGIPQIVGGKGSSFTAETDSSFDCVIRTPNRDFACGTHVVPRGNGEIYVGATNRISSTPGAKGNVTLGELHSQIHSAIHEINTDLRTASISGYRSGLRPLSADGFPIVGQTDVDGLLVATGTYRNGVLMAPKIAELITETIVHGASAANNFEPSNRAALVSGRSRSSIIASGVRDLVSFIQEPHGSLPYNRAQELEDLLTTLIVELSENHSDREKLQTAIGLDIHGEISSEVVASILYGAHARMDADRKSRK